MISERRGWVIELKRQQNGKAPEDLKGFYEKFNAEDALSPEE